MYNTDNIDNIDTDYSCLIPRGIHIKYNNIEQTTVIVIRHLFIIIFYIILYLLYTFYFIFILRRYVNV